MEEKANMMGPDNIFKTIVVAIYLILIFVVIFFFAAPLGDLIESISTDQRVDHYEEYLEDTNLSEKQSGEE